MKLIKTTLLLITILMTIVSCETNSSQQDYNKEISALFSDYKDYTFYTYPEYASYEGIHDYSDRLTDQSLEGIDIYVDSIKKYLAQVKAISTKDLSSTNQLNQQLFIYSLEESIQQTELKIGNYLGFSQQNGFHINVPQIIGYQPLKTEKDIDNYLKRLKQFKPETDNIIALLKDGRVNGIVSPCNITKQVLAQLETFSNTKIDDSPFYSVVKDNELLEARKSELKDVITNYIQPGYQNLLDYYKTNYHPNCRTEVGISSVDGGSTFYEFLIKKYTNSDQSPNDVFNTGKSEVARIKDEIKKVQTELGYENLDLNAFYTELRNNPKFYFQEKEDLMNGFRIILKEMDTKLPDLFGQLPKTPYDLKEIEEYRAAAAPAAYYYNAPSDGSRPGYFYVNTYNLSARPKYTMTALALHEAVPGHHLQIALAKELENVPWFRNEMSVTAFIEGWGLYAEYLGYETGMYEDPLQKLGALTFEMWRACRLVVDVGLHYKNWTREEAMNFMRTNLPLSELDIQSEIDRYISWPGQAVAYKTGELKLKELRAKTEETLGDQFDIKAFHDAVLENGSIPLTLLEDKVDIWIKKVK